MLAFALVAGSVWVVLELSSSLMEKMQSRDLLLGVPELDDLGQFLRSLPTSTLLGLGALTAVLVYWISTRPRPITPPCDLRLQSQEVQMEDGARRSLISDSSTLLSYYHEDAKTMYEVFQRGLHITGDGPFLGSRLPNQPYKWLSYREVSSRAEHLGSGLLSQGCQPSPDQFIGVFAQNRPEWIISELACYTYSMVVVPLYDTLGPDAIRYIINTAEISTVICDKAEKASVLLENVQRGETPGLKMIILMDAFDTQLLEEAQKCSVHIRALRDVEALGREHYRKPVPPAADDLSIVCFTSGTTGDPKGVMLTHGNVVADFGGFLKVTDKVIFPNQDDVLISFLPLAHMFERLIEAVVICHGGRIGFFQGDIRLLPDDMKALRPTIFPVVPRLLNRMYDKIFSQANTSLKRWLLNFAAKRKGLEVRRGVIRSDSVWDKIFFHKIQASLGGRLRMIITGAAPASPIVLDFLRAALGCQVYEAYGQTECTAGCTYTTPGDWTAGHVGAPLPCNLIKLLDVAEKNYFAAKGEGEICVKGPNVFKGYLKDPVRTAETLDADGWLHTGDIGKWLPNGTLKIIDRKKHIFKLAQGEYISPEKIESIYIRSEPVSQLYVHGDSLQSCLVGVIVPDPEVLPSWAQKKGFVGSYDELCGNKEIKKAILEDMVCLGRASGLHSFEQVKDIHIHKEMFSVQNGLLTPTLKAKRPELKQYFKTEIEQLYSNISM
ncbi:long-chain-fatty-acid--CoA ligase 6 isoform X2 [Carassius auratus]|uniref:Long-chain-fatty-acid--CoA ligase n=2 Tax=Carassius auratus TaxID=7957 RepID=A0A6P6LZJ9_CARAU|nr:long-chain-fatty-acid--CoA ligase 6-like isoform X2 [Carassius auratus]XP_052392395.1 long-chain-fatty-acid--CoA ligase 6-like isoform X2 [Carassius gibelio]